MLIDPVVTPRKKKIEKKMNNGPKGKWFFKNNLNKWIRIYELIQKHDKIDHKFID